MRKYLIIFVTLTFLVSCNGGVTDGGVDIGKDPVSECVVPASARCGDEVILQWNGFTDDASIILRTSVGEGFSVDLQVITESGLIFKVPHGLVPGKYDIVLIQDGEVVLGQIEIMASEIPVFGISLPSSAIAGETVTITGVGFDNTSEIVLELSGHSVFPEVSLVNGGLTFVVPEDIAQGAWEVYLSQQGGRWLVSDSFMITVAMRKLASVAFTALYSGQTLVEYKWNISDEDMPVVTLTERFIEGDSVTEGCADVYEPVSAGSWILAEDGFEMSNDMEISYILDGEENVSASDVLIYGKSKPTRFTWVYDAGYLCDVTYESKNGVVSFRTIGYENGNITSFGNVSFLYDDPSLKNNPLAYDVVWGYMAVMEKFDPFMYFPYLTGMYDVKSQLLPTSIVLNTGLETLAVPVSYEFDADGYVMEMSWKENGHSNKVSFTYHL